MLADAPARRGSRPPPGAATGDHLDFDSRPASRIEDLSGAELLQDRHGVTSSAGVRPGHRPDDGDSCPRDADGEAGHAGE